MACPSSIEVALSAIEALQAYGKRVLQKFNSGTSSGDLLAETADLEARIKGLIALLPDGISLGDWKRKI